MTSSQRLLLLAFAASAALAHASAVDCKLASTPREHAICNTPELATLDSRVSLAYEHLLAQASPAAAALLRADQQAWLHWLDIACPATNDVYYGTLNSCLKDSLYGRLVHLPDAITLPDGHIIFTRSLYLPLPPNTSTVTAAQEKGSGYGETFFWPQDEFFWPQIDKPTPQEAAWNQAIHTYAISLSGNNTHHPKTFNDSLEPSFQLTLPYVIRSANANLISTRFRLFTATSGGGNSINIVHTFNWWMDRRRELEPNDIFRQDTPWQTALIDPAITKLKDTLKGAVWQGDDLRKRVAADLADPHHWTISSAGLQIAYSEYAVTPFVDGTILVDFPWPELKPYLNPAFDPTQLPTLLDSNPPPR